MQPMRRGELGEANPYLSNGYSPKYLRRDLLRSTYAETVHKIPILRRIRPLRTLKAQTSDHYIWRTSIQMRSGQYAAPPQDTDAG
jgi:hypothetical protein